ncbi:hypothetical protein BGZ76_006545 [Entomortierella beljakovae]|nr:hypothetical protein BGZ76_006545 [Entomortierella beljakovae]
MGMLIERDLEGELMSKIKVIIEKALDWDVNLALKIDRYSVSSFYVLVGGKPIPLFDFEQIVDGLDENDPFMKDIFTFLVKDVAQRYRDTHASEDLLRPPTIHHSLTQPIPSSSASSSATPASSDSHPTSFSSLVFNSRVLRHNQLFRSLLNDDDNTEAGQVSESTRRQNLWLTNTANSTSSPPDSTERAPSTLGRLQSSQGQVSEDDSDSEDDYSFFRLRREPRTLNPTAPGTSQPYETHQRYYSPFRSSFPFYSSSATSWGSGRHPIVRSHLGQSEENTGQSNEVTYNDSRRSVLLRHLQALSHSQSRIRGLQRQQLQQLQQQSEQPALALTTLSIDSGPTSFPSGSLVPSSDSELGVSRSSVIQSLDANQNLNPVQEEATLILDEEPAESGVSFHVDTPSITPEPPINQTLTDAIIPAQSQPTLSHQIEDYNEFADESRRSRATMRARNLAMSELRSMRRRTLDVVDRFADILDYSEQTTPVYDATTSEMDGQQSEPAQQMEVVAAEAEDIQTPREEIPAPDHVVETREYSRMRNPRNVG